MSVVAKVLALFLAVGLCVAAGMFVYSTLGNQPLTNRITPGGWDKPVGGSDERQVFTIRPGQTASAVGEELQQRGLIRSAVAFRLELESRGLGTKLGAGDHELSPSMSTPEIVSALARGALSHGTSMTILEGWRA